MHKTPPQNLLPDIIHVKSLFVIGKHFVGMGEFGGHSGLSATETQQYTNCQVSNIHTSKISPTPKVFNSKAYCQKSLEEF